MIVFNKPYKALKTIGKEIKLGFVKWALWPRGYVRRTYFDDNPLVYGSFLGACEGTMYTLIAYMIDLTNKGIIFKNYYEAGGLNFDWRLGLFIPIVSALRMIQSKYEHYKLSIPYEPPKNCQASGSKT